MSEISDDARKAATAAVDKGKLRSYFWGDQEVSDAVKRNEAIAIVAQAIQQAVAPIEAERVRQEERERFLAALLDGLAIYPEGDGKDAIDYVREAHAAAIRARTKGEG